MDFHNAHKTHSTDQNAHKTHSTDTNHTYYGKYQIAVKQFGWK